MYVYEYKITNRTHTPHLQSAGVSTMKPPFRTRTDISARLSQSPSKFLSFAGA